MLAAMTATRRRGGTRDGALERARITRVTTDADTAPVIGPAERPEQIRSRRLPRLARHTITLSDGHDVGVAVCGRGVPLVLVHGFTAEGMLYAAPSGASPGSASGSLPWTAPATAAPHRWASGKPRWHR